MPEGVDFPFPSLLFYEGRTYGQPEVVRISLPQVATGLRLCLPGSFRRRGFQPEIKAGYGRKGVTDHGDFSLYSKDCWTQQRKIHHIGVCLSQWRCDEK